MTDTDLRRLTAELRTLRREWKRIVAGEYLPSGVLMCDHKVVEPRCEGCGGRQYARDLAAPLAERGAAIKAQLEATPCQTR